MTKPLQAGIYCRLSLAKYGDTANVDDQEHRGRQSCRQRGWQIAKGVGYPEPNGVFVDNSVSAWKLGVRRPGWEAMLEAVDAGKLQALWVYHGDRLIRRPEDLGRLLGVARVKGIQLASGIGDRDLGNPDDEYILWIEAAGFGRESASTSRRMKRDIERRRNRGIVNSGGRGGRLFGFETDGVTHVPAEAAIVREVITAVQEGNGIRSIAADLAQRGVTTTAGKPMHAMAVKRILRSPRYAGLMPDGASKAAWEPIVGQEDWERARSLASDRAGPLMPGHTARRYLLTGIATCEKCGGGMQALPAYTRKATGIRVASRYGCMKPGCRKVWRSLAHLDEYTITATLGRLNHPGNPPGRIPESPGLAAQFAALSVQQTETEAMIADPDAGMPLNLLRSRLATIAARLAELRDLAAGDAQSRMRGTHAGLTRDAFDALPLGVRRSLVAACFAVTVLPASRRGPGFNPADVRLTPL